MSIPMTRPDEEGVESRQDDGREAPPVWTAPDFVEKSLCAEIGAYAFREG